MTALWSRWEFSATSCLSPSTQFSFSMCPVIWIRWLGANQLQVSLIGVLVVLKTFKTMVLISQLPYERLLHVQTILYIFRNRCGCRVRINDSLGTFFFLFSFFWVKDFMGRIRWLLFVRTLENWMCLWFSSSPLSMMLLLIIHMWLFRLGTISCNSLCSSGCYEPSQHGFNFTLALWTATPCPDISVCLEI